METEGEEDDELINTSVPMPIFIEYLSKEEQKKLIDKNGSFKNRHIKGDIRDIEDLREQIEYREKDCVLYTEYGWFDWNEPAQVELLTYTDDNNGVNLIKWYTLVTDGRVACINIYEDWNHDGIYQIKGKPILFDAITKRKGILSTIYEIELKDGKKKFEVIELSDNYFPGKSILNRKEQEVYKQYQQTKSDSLLKELSPNSIAKFYVQAKLDDDGETEYALMEEYKPELNMMGWTKEEHLAYIQENIAKDKEKGDGGMS